MSDHSTAAASRRFAAAIARGVPLLVDGGLATELEAQGHDIGTTLWSAALLRSNPEAISRAHRAYLDAGAECIISASYQASRHGFTAIGMDAVEADNLIASSIAIAIAARDSFVRARPEPGFEPLVAASVGPYGAILHDGSEYRGGYAIDRVALRSFHEERLGLLDRCGADVLACETIPDRQEADVLADLLRTARTPAWVSFSCRDERHLCDGTPVHEAAAIFRDHPQVLAIGINCTAPQFIGTLIGEIRSAAPRKAVVVYPNSGERYDAHDNTWHGTVSTADCAAAAIEWRAAGASLIGGCCRMGPAHVRAMRAALRPNEPDSR